MFLIQAFPVCCCLCRVLFVAVRISPFALRGNSLWEQRRYYGHESLSSEIKSWFGSATLDEPCRERERMWKTPPWVTFLRGSNISGHSEAVFSFPKTKCLLSIPPFETDFTCGSVWHVRVHNSCSGKTHLRVFDDHNANKRQTKIWILFCG